MRGVRRSTDEGRSQMTILSFEQLPLILVVAYRFQATATYFGVVLLGVEVETSRG